MPDLEFLDLHNPLPRPERETKQRTRERNVTKILAAAERVFAEAGYKGASFSMIAEEADVPKSNVAYYFRSKEALYRLVIEDIFRLWLSASSEMDKTDDPRKALEIYIHDKMELARERPYGSKVWANEIIHGAPFIKNYIDGELREWVASRETILKRWMDDGHIRQMEPKSILYMIWAATQHYADFNYQIEALNDYRALDDKQWEQAKADVTRTILQGIGLTQ